MRSRTRLFAAGLTALALTIGGSMLASAPVAAAPPYDVTNNGDSGAGSLRDAIVAANGAAGLQTIDINIAGPTTITLLTPIPITDSIAVTVSGPAPTVTHSNANVMLEIAPAVAGLTLAISGPLTFDGGGFAGSAIWGVSPTTTASVDLAGITFQNLYGNNATHFETVTGAVTVTDCTFLDNSSSFGGGAIFFAASSGDLIVNTSYFEGNGTFADGGAIKTVQVDDVTISGSDFVSNGAGEGGGAVSIGASDDVVINEVSTFTSNEVTNGSGGALSVFSVGDVELSDTQWILNSADADEDGDEARGGAVNASNTGRFTVELSLFSRNSVSASEEAFIAYGGAIVLNAVDGLTTLLTSDFAENTAAAPAGDARGGAVYFADMGETVNVAESQFTGNEIDGSAGPGQGEMGAAIAAETVDYPLTIGNSSFDNQVLSQNPLGATSVGVGVVSDEFTIVNSTFNEPIVLDGFGARPPMVFVTDFEDTGVFLAEHSTFIGAFAIRLDENEAGTFTVSHSAFQSDSDPILAEHNDVPTSYSAFSGATGTIVNTVGNKIGVALLLGTYGENGGPTKTALPQTGSPLIDTGNPAIAFPPVFDQRGPGFDRVVRIIDIGAVEVQIPESELAATGATIPWWALVAGILLLLGGALVARTRITAND